MKDDTQPTMYVEMEYGEPKEDVGCDECQDGWQHIQHPCKPLGVIMHSIPCPKCNADGSSPDPHAVSSWTYTVIPKAEVTDTFTASTEIDFNDYIFDTIVGIMYRPGLDRRERESMLAAFMMDLAEKAHYGALGTRDYIADVEQDCRDLKTRLELAENVVREVQTLRNRGYDGPFMGADIELLLTRLHEWEKEQT
jgi:hypothetical protein